MNDSKKIIIVNNHLSGFIYSSLLLTYYLSLIIKESNLYLLFKYLLPMLVLNTALFS